MLGGPWATCTSDHLVIHLRVLPNPSGAIICHKDSQNSGGCYVDESSVITEDASEDQPNGEEPGPGLGGSQTRKISLLAR